MEWFGRMTKRTKKQMSQTIEAFAHQAICPFYIIGTGLNVRSTIVLLQKNLKIDICRTLLIQAR